MKFSGDWRGYCEKNDVTLPSFVKKKLYEYGRKRKKYKLPSNLSQVIITKIGKCCLACLLGVGLFVYLNVSNFSVN